MSLRDLHGQFSKRTLRNCILRNMYYGDIFSKDIESFNTQILEECFFPICVFTDKVWNKLLVQMSKWRESLSHYTSTVCLNIEKWLRIILNKHMSLLYTRSLQYMFEFHDEYIHMVDSDRRPCTLNMCALSSFRVCMLFVI